MAGTRHTFESTFPRVKPSAFPIQHPQNSQAQNRLCLVPIWKTTI